MKVLTSTNPYFRDVSGSIKVTSLIASKSSQALSKGFRSDLSVVEQYLSNSLNKETKELRVINQNIGYRVSQLQIMKNSLTEMKETASSMVKDLLFYRKANDKHKEAVKQQLNEKIDRFNTQLDDTKFDGQALLSIGDFNAEVRIGTSINDTTSIKVTEMFAMDNGVEVNGYAADAISKTYTDTVSGLLTSTQDIIEYTLGSMPYKKDDGDVGQALYELIPEIVDNSANAQGALDNFKDAINKVSLGQKPSLAGLQTGAQIQNIQKIVDAGSGIVRSATRMAVGIKAGILSYTDGSVTNNENARLLIEVTSLSNINTMHLYDDEQVNKTERAIKRHILEELDKRLMQVNSRLEHMNSIGESIDKKINVTEEVVSNMADADVVKTAQDFVDALHKMITMFSVLAGGNQLSQEVVKQTTSTLQSAARANEK